MHVADVRALEPLTPCLQSVNQRNVTDSYGLLSCSVFLAFRDSSHVSKLLPSAMVCDLGVHQIVHQEKDSRERSVSVSQSSELRKSLLLK